MSEALRSGTLIAASRARQGLPFILRSKRPWRAARASYVPRRR
jgi:hypothetical protein